MAWSSAYKDGGTYMVFVVSNRKRKEVRDDLRRISTGDDVAGRRALKTFLLDSRGEDADDRPLNGWVALTDQPGTTRRKIAWARGGWVTGGQFSELREVVSELDAILRDEVRWGRLRAKDHNDPRHVWSRVLGQTPVLEVA